jgi:hypothetical protein
MLPPNFPKMAAEIGGPHTTADGRKWHGITLQNSGDRNSVKCNSELVFPGYQSREDFLKDFEQEFGTCAAYKQIETFYNWVLKTMEETPQ